MTERTGYVCSLCMNAGTVKHIYFTKSSAVRHEESCFNNIDSRACATCEYWKTATDEDYWKTCFHLHDLATGASKPIRECPYWKIRVEESEEDSNWT